MLCHILSLAALLTTLAFVVHANAADQKAHLLLKAHAMVESVNTANVGWKAQVYPRFAQMAPEQRRAMNGLNWDPKASKENFRGAKDPNSRRMPEDSPILLRADELPEEFDPRVQWPECKEVINNIRDQSKCGDCWAVAAAGAFSDRICIASGGKQRPSVSSIDTASCAMEEADGCQGAKTLEPAWAYFQKSGVVSGSGYGSRQGCKPYPFPLSAHAKRDYMAPICTPACTNAWHKGTYKEDKIYADKPIQLHSKEWKNKELLLKQEIYQHGPVAVGFIVFDDFYYYHSGIYHQLSTEAEGGHAVRLVGWGVEKGQPYWLVANSWGPDWGEGGFFRISRGTNEAYIEEIDAYAGMPILPTEK